MRFGVYLSCESTRFDTYYESVFFVNGYEYSDHVAITALVIEWFLGGLLATTLEHIQHTTSYRKQLRHTHTIREKNHYNNNTHYSMVHNVSTS